MAWFVREALTGGNVDPGAHRMQLSRTHITILQNDLGQSHATDVPVAVLRHLGNSGVKQKCNLLLNKKPAITEAAAHKGTPATVASLAEFACDATLALEPTFAEPSETHGGGPAACN